MSFLLTTLLWVAGSILLLMVLGVVVGVVLYALFITAKILVLTPVGWFIIFVAVWMVAFDSKDRSEYVLDPSFVAVCKRTPSCIEPLRALDNLPSEVSERPSSTSRQ